MDVHRPANPNGYGIILVSGSGWTAPMVYSAAPLKSITPLLQYAKPLVAAGYTVFSVNHRALPRFHHPATVEEVQRLSALYEAMRRASGSAPIASGPLTNLREATL
jgi:acetyl esterase/lipase